MLQIESFNDEELDPATSKNIFSINKKPIQTRIKYPETNKRKFQSKWFDEHTWLEYSVSTDSAYCFCCRHFNNINFFNSSSSSSSYVGHSSQKEILDLGAKQIRQNLIPKECFAIILDETADLARINLKTLKNA
jgi:hypothetical protein